MKKNLLITGGNGFLGKNLISELKKSKKYKQYQIIIASRNNEKNYLISSKLKCKFIPMDVSNIESVREGLYLFKPEIIIHAAATKYVQLSEKYPFETVETNILGSMNIVRVSKEINCKIVIGISTDKSAQPIENLYGLSKAISERIFLSQNNLKSKTKFACVRFGNIAWSSGSVFHIWKKMIDTDGKILTTGPDMKRFFFSINEATKLVVRAIDKINKINGKILVLKMKSAYIKEILEIYSSIYKCNWKKTKKRIGDKKHEFLVSENELPYSSKINIDNKEHFIISPLEKVKIPLIKTFSTMNSEKLSDAEIKKLIKKFYE